MTNQRGFTLIELAIVLVIITILIGGLAMPLSAQIQARRIAETQRTLEQAHEAIIGYALTHQNAGQPYLPCPDTGGDGIEETRDGGGACPTAEGFYPWVSLGTAAQDAWGNRLRYRVTASFSNSNGFLNTDSGDIQVCSTSSCTVADVASNVPAVVVSYGSNGWGAQNVNGNTLKTPTSADELENINSDVKFVSRTPYKPADGSAAEQAKEFDDLVVWISDSLLRSRVCPAGGCP